MAFIKCIEIIVKAVLSISLVLIVLFPNISLAIEQINRTQHGLESLIAPFDEAVISLAEEAKANSNGTVEEYVLSKIPYASDYDVYYNLEYWATPTETLKNGMGDCEDRAILIKSIQEYLQIKSTLVVQRDHVYVQRDGIAYGGISKTQSDVEAVWNIITGIPLIRKIIIILGLIAIWGYSYLFKKAKKAI
ncbi:MAG: hypothetical protein QXQ02_06570 [Halobacteria archaeon]